jgi:hypothetical protein
MYKRYTVNHFQLLVSGGGNVGGQASTAFCASTQAIGVFFLDIARV